MKLIGIKNSAEFKQKVLKQRELLKSGNKVENIHTDSETSQIVDVLTEIKDILIEIKGK